MTIGAPTGWVIEAIEKDPIARAILASRETTLIVPLELLPEFAQLVSDYADQNGSKVFDCCRAVEIAVLRLGIIAAREELMVNVGMTPLASVVDRDLVAEVVANHLRGGDRS